MTLPRWFYTVPISALYFGPRMKQTPPFFCECMNNRMSSALIGWFTARQATMITQKQPSLCVNKLRLHLELMLVANVPYWLSIWTSTHGRLKLILTMELSV